MHTRRVPIGLAVAALVAFSLALAGCGGGKSENLARLAPANSPIYVEGAIDPGGELGENVRKLAKTLAGVEDLGALIVEDLEGSAMSSGKPLDFEKEVEPWLGERAAVFLRSFEGGDFSGYGLLIEATDSTAAQEFIDERARPTSGELREASFEGVRFKVEPEGGEAIGVLDGAVLFTEDEATYKAAIEASGGESLAAQESFAGTMEAATEGSLVDVFVDVGGLLEQAGGELDPEARRLLDDAGIDPSEATAVASVVPGADQIQIDASTKLGEAEPGDAGNLLESLPGGSFAAFATSGFGEALREAIDSLDQRGVPGQLEPGELKEAASAIGIDLDRLAGSIKEAAVFGQGNTRRNLTGALVMTTSGSEATQLVGQLGKLLRLSGAPGVTFLSGEAKGFSIRSPELGSKPLVVAAKGGRIAISLGLAASAQALTAEPGATLAEDPAFQEARKALGETPISGFLDGPAVLTLVRGMISADERPGFEEARPYLEKVAFGALGTGTSGDRTTLKMIVGLAK
ncbi:MAG: DUF3352 domain-containing protein [Syntrophothermus sp.]